MKRVAFKDGHLIFTFGPNVFEATHFSGDDDAIAVELREDGASDEVGADGRMMVSINADDSGELTCKLQQTSPTNKLLNLMYALQKGAGSNFIPCNAIYQDTNRQDRLSLAFGYIKKLPGYKRGKKGQVLEWMFVFETVTYALGDPLFLGLPTAVAEAA